MEAVPAYRRVVALQTAIDELGGTGVSPVPQPKRWQDVHGARQSKFDGALVGPSRAIIAVFCAMLLGCAGLDSKAFEAPLSNAAKSPRELALLCRPQVLKLDDGTRSPGVVAQLYLTGGDDLEPVSAPEGVFAFRAFDAASDREVETWTFSGDEVPKHRIDHSLGPCYAFWLPLKSSKTPVREVVVYGSFTFDGQELGSKPVRVSVPGR